MEPNEFDKWAREAVEQSEDGAQLDAEHADTLWSHIEEHKPKTYVAYWRAAAIILFFLSLGIAWYSSGLRADQNALQAQLEHSNLQFEQLANTQETTDPKGVEEVPAPIPEKEIVLVYDTIVRRVVEERIVYVEQPVQQVIETMNTDSLIAIIEDQRAALAQLDAYAQVDEPKTYMNSFNVVFDNEEEQTTKTPSVKKEGGLKLNISLFNKN